MKIRIGVGTGLRRGVRRPAIHGRWSTISAHSGSTRSGCRRSCTAPTHDPLVAMAFAAAHNRQLKIGTTMLLPGRNLVRLAKELATLDVLSEGRLLLTFVPGLPRGPEVTAVGVAPG